MLCSAVCHVVLVGSATSVQMGESILKAGYGSKSVRRRLFFVAMTYIEEDIVSDLNTERLGMGLLLRLDSQLEHILKPPQDSNHNRRVGAVAWI